MSAEERRIMEFNQRVGELFDDWWMFGDHHAIRRLRKLFR